ncbi:hypothetical protein MKQ70_13730 [Chitinophaga sedimenti]|uniref:hypothetical protein n=1 Tax=Chitinophaga sedimenti TaxID=2033606 RepID=UPI00200575BC|nr:hypothetical protein [Chitinophaga sedimenti]MCK7556023.1 hypothetical protein [Chitinophaga sedimenti]
MVESGYATSTGGRRPQIYSLKPDIMHIISVAMDQFVTRMGIPDMHNQFVGEQQQIALDLSATPDALQELGKHRWILSADRVSKKTALPVSVLVCRVS